MPVTVTAGFHTYTEAPEAIAFVLTLLIVMLRVEILVIRPHTTEPSTWTTCSTDWLAIMPVEAVTGITTLVVVVEGTPAATAAVVVVVLVDTAPGELGCATLGVVRLGAARLVTLIWYCRTASVMLVVVPDSVVLASPAASVTVAGEAVAN